MYNIQKVEHNRFGKGRFGIQAFWMVDDDKETGSIERQSLTILRP